MSQEQVDTLSYKLLQTASNDAQVARDASMWVSLAQEQPGFIQLIVSSLSQACKNQIPGSETIKILATNILLNMTRTRWACGDGGVRRGHVQPLTNDEKAFIRSLLIDAISTSAGPVLRTFLAILRVAVKNDWPQAWPELVHDAAKAYMCAEQDERTLLAAVAVSTRVFQQAIMMLKLRVPEAKDAMNSALSLFQYLCIIYDRAVRNGNDDEVTLHICHLGAKAFKYLMRAPGELLAAPGWISEWCLRMMNTSAILINTHCTHAPYDFAVKHAMQGLLSLSCQLQVAVTTLCTQKSANGIPSPYLTSLFVHNNDGIVARSLTGVLVPIFHAARDCAQYGEQPRQVLGHDPDPAIRAAGLSQPTRASPSSLTLALALRVLYSLQQIASVLPEDHPVKQLCLKTPQTLLGIGSMATCVTPRALEQARIDDTTEVARAEFREAPQSFAASGCFALIRLLCWKIIEQGFDISGIISALAQDIHGTVSAAVAGSVPVLSLVRATGSVSVLQFCCTGQHTTHAYWCAAQHLFECLFLAQDGQSLFVKLLSLSTQRAHDQTGDADSAVLPFLVARLLVAAGAWVSTGRDLYQPPGEHAFASILIPVCAAVISTESSHPMLRVAGCVCLQSAVSCASAAVVSKHLEPRLGQLLWNLLDLSKSFDAASGAYSAVVEALPQTSVTFAVPTFQVLTQTIESHLVQYWSATAADLYDLQTQSEVAACAVIEAAESTTAALAQNAPQQLPHFVRQALIPFCQTVLSATSGNTPQIQQLLGEFPAQAPLPEVLEDLVGVLEAATDWPDSALTPAQALDVCAVLTSISSPIIELQQSPQIISRLQGLQVTCVRRAMDAAYLESHDAPLSVVTQDNVSVSCIFQSVIQSLLQIGNESCVDLSLICACQTALLILLTPSLAPLLLSQTREIMWLAGVIFNISANCDNSNDVDIQPWPCAVTLAAFAANPESVPLASVDNSIHTLTASFMTCERDGFSDASNGLDSLIGLAYLSAVATALAIRRQDPSMEIQIQDVSIEIACRITKQLLELEQVDETEDTIITVPSPPPQLRTPLVTLHDLMARISSLVSEGRR